MSGNFSVSYNAGGTVDKLKKVEGIDNLANVGVVQEIKSIGSIVGFAKKTQPYNTMFMINVPAGVDKIVREFTLPDEEVEVLAISITCSGYGEEDNFNLYFNGELWFENWYCSEVKDGLFLGSSTYVYQAPPNSILKLEFKNESQTSKKVWVGVRMLKNPPSLEEENRKDINHVK